METRQQSCQQEYETKSIFISQDHYHSYIGHSYNQVGSYNSYKNITYILYNTAQHSILQ